MPKFSPKELAEIEENTRRIEQEREKSKGKPGKKKSKKKTGKQQDKQSSIKERLIGPFLLLATVVVSYLVMVIFG